LVDVHNDSLGVDAVLEFVAGEFVLVVLEIVVLE